MQHAWLSVHVVIDNLQDDVVRAGDALLAHPIREVWQQLNGKGLVDRVFVVRYVDTEHHVRLRLRTPLPVERAQETLYGFLECAGCRYRAQPYAPELERYGGEVGVAACEEVFHASTLLVLELLQASDGLAVQRRAGFALLATLIHVAAFLRGPEQQRAGIAAYARSLAARYSGSDEPLRSARELAGREIAFANVLARLKAAGWAEAAYPAPFRPFRQAVDDCAERLRTSGVIPRRGLHASQPLVERSVMLGLCHMTNNRLGLAPAEEAVLCELLASLMAGY